MLDEEQKQILHFFQHLEKDYNYQPPAEVYLSSSKTLEPEKKQLIAPLINENDFEAPHDELRKKLLQYKLKSNSVQEVGQLVNQYQSKFEEMLKKRDQLLNVISDINKQTSELVQKQKKYIDLTVGVKEALGYYLYMDKFEFNWACEINCREMFEDQLQSILSQLTDGINFFTLNHHYSSAKKYLNLYTSNKSKVTSFTKSFFVKLLNKQYSFSIKNAKSMIWTCINNFYPKSKPKFLTEFLSCFPQFKKQLSTIVSNAKYSIKEEQLTNLQGKQFEIEEFQLTNSSLSLIAYMQKNIRDVYEEIILKFIGFYRGNLHENLCKNISSDIPANASFCDAFRQKFISICYVILSEAAYLSYCFRPSTEIPNEYIRVILAKVGEYYTQFLVRFIKDPKNKDPFSLCSELSFLSEEIERFIKNYFSRDYEGYALGAVCHFIDERQIGFIKNLLEGLIKKLKVELEPVCQHLLPKISICNDKKKLTEEVKILINTSSYLKYCPNSSQKYLISCLDSIVKSIKVINTQIESRIECYAWNIEVFGALEQCLEKVQCNIIKKQIKLDLQETTSIFEKIRQVERGNSMIKYASDIFNALKTGVPTLNELTLNYDKFISEYYMELKEKFRADMVFIHGKNMIQFLQKLKQAKENQSICQTQVLKALYDGFMFSLQNFVTQANEILKQRKEYSLLNEGQENLKELLSQVWETLLKLLANFYIELSKITEETTNFASIPEIREKYKEFVVEKQRKK